jgi:hypothetical protein
MNDKSFVEIQAWVVQLQNRSEYHKPWIELNWIDILFRPTQWVKYGLEHNQDQEEIAYNCAPRRKNKRKKE